MTLTTPFAIDLIRVDGGTQGRARTDQAAEQLAPAPARPEGGFTVVVVAPAWSCMTIEEVAALPVAEFTAPDAVVCLWTPPNRLADAIAVLKVWGCHFWTMRTWMKTLLRATDSVVGQVEHCVLGVRGEPDLATALSEEMRETWRTRQVVWQKGVAERHNLSAFYELVESLSSGPRLEIFVQSGREGWTSWASATR